MRRARRRRRIRLWTSGIIATALVALSIYLFVLYQTNQAQLAAIAAQHDNATGTALTSHASATAGAQANASATAGAKAGATATAVSNIDATAAAVSAATITAGTPTPKAGAASPPAVSGNTVTTSDGLKYIDVKEGSGEAAKPGDTLYVIYTGWLQSNNKEFDSSYDHGGQSYPVKIVEAGQQPQVIQGWNEGLVGMKVGGTRRLIIPPTLAYGDQGQGPIPANATLIFDVTIVLIKHA